MLLSPRTGLTLVVLFVLGHALLGALSITGGLGTQRVGITYDEPLHAVGAWHIRYRSDFRVNREDPALFLRYVSLWTRAEDVATPYDAAAWQETRQGTFAPRDYLRRAVYGDGVVPERVVLSARWGSLLISVLLVAATAAVAWGAAGRVLGPTAAAIAAMVVGLDPLILGHGVLVKNDVPMALVLLGVAWCVRCVMQERVSVGWVAGLVVLSAAAPLVKFSGVLVAPVVGALLLARAFSAKPWNVAGIEFVTIKGRLAAVGLMLAACLVGFVVLAWAVYGFRFNAVDGPERISVSSLLGLTAGFEYRAANPGTTAPPPPGSMAGWQPPAAVAAAVWAYKHQLLPEALLTGWIYTYASSMYRPAFLLGEIRGTGWWYYFPLAWMFKTPLTVLVLAMGSAIIVLSRPGRVKRHAWLVVPPAVFLVAAMVSNLNIGLRHVLPVLPFLAVGIGLVAAAAVQKWGRWAGAVVAGMVVLLVFEVLPQQGRHIQFFNLASGSSRGGLRLLSDSNLDWGQDLPRLIQWRKENPEQTLYIYRFGHFTDFGKLGLVGTNLAAGDPGEGPGVLAVSATYLQGMYISDPSSLKYFEYLRKQEPMTTLGDTIYLFAVPGRPLLPPR